MAARNQTIISEINITPLTDIFLVLLIIMMVVAPMLDYPGLKLSVPSMGPDVETTEKPNTLNIVITEADEFWIDKEQVMLDRMPHVIRRLSKISPDGVVIEAHPEASHNAMTQLMDAAQRAGVEKMAVVALQE